MELKVSGTGSGQSGDSFRHQGDWSSQICAGASIKDLDRVALEKARREFAKKFPQYAKYIDYWDDQRFLSKAKLSKQGKITNTSILLLGKNESEHFIGPAVAKISWIHHDDKTIGKDYAHLGPPLILHAQSILDKIQNAPYRFPDDLIPLVGEAQKFDPMVIRKVLYNCIAHQDYTLGGRINVVETDRELIFTNLGSFIPKSVEAIINQDAPPEYYRNKFLAEAMVNLNMIDTIGSGIKKVFLSQKKRLFPMPDYDLSEKNRIKVRIYARILNPTFCRILAAYPDMSLNMAIALDKIQKGIDLTKREQRLLELHTFSKNETEFTEYVSEAIGKPKIKSFDNAYLKQVIIDYLRLHNSATRKEINLLLTDFFSNKLGEEQKRNKVKNLLYAMSRRDASIKNEGSNKKPVWILC
ncbi:MAG: hypothetical protein B6244_12585 [Candidatus Cloacimonetes bacterium 4572_55]|nr:MAG: hypothetical protein B6244_12585 [Candidatus Cloacimonetes bacterium 4572_55]